MSTRNSDTPFPPEEVIRILAEATEHFLGDHNCDHDRWETTRAAAAASVAAIEEIKHLKLVSPREPWDVRAADALADEVAVLTRLKILDERSAAADALLDYRNPPCTPRSDRLADLERRRSRLLSKVEAQLAAIKRLEEQCGPGGLSDPYKAQRNVMSWVRDELVEND